jgi:ABC-type polysaccharide/polyol phosphate transport system ATPase subunit
VSKCYHLYDKAQDRLKQAIFPHLHRLLGMSVTSYAREFWALKDVCFEVKRGETVGIVGRNGSGKYRRFCKSSQGRWMRPGVKFKCMAVWQHYWN